MVTLRNLNMAKQRIYELARELGLDNKVLLDMCEKMGIYGKSSHSNTLSDEEADKIRRNVLRKAVSERASDTVKESKVGDHLVTERRMGDVIRRRRRSVELDNEIDQHPVPGYDHHEEELAVHEPVEQGSPQIEEHHEGESTEVFFDESVKASAESVEENIPEDLETIVESSEVEPEENLWEVSLALSESSSAQHEQGEEDLPIAESGQHADLEVKDGSSSSKSSPSSVESSTFDLEEVRRRLDIRAPKVLGRIDLPVALVKTKQSEKEKENVPKSSKESGREGRGGGATAGAFTEEESSGASGRKKHKDKRRSETLEDDDMSSSRPRRRQVLRKADLVDYETMRDSWKVRKDKKSKKEAAKETAPANIVTAVAKASKRVVKLDSEISVGEFSRQMGVKAGEVIKKLMGLGVMATVNKLIDFDTATLIASEFDYTVVNTGGLDQQVIAEAKREDKPEELVSRPPIVTVMGHVDHGKTSLLDAIRNTSVTKKEAGGITQHIGAYNVTTASGGVVTFIDTPGHEAFTSMRSRGAKVTDVVVLVVAADDGVMPQTVEAINHARAAKVPIIVAINKMDKEQANPERVRSNLADNGLIPEEWGGDTIVVPVSAHTGMGLDLLLENILLQSAVLELKANPNRLAIGAVIESKLDRGRGPVMTVLIQNGTLRKGDTFVVGATFGRVKALYSDAGAPLNEAGPGCPVEVLGSEAVPAGGDEFVVLPNEQEARQIAIERAMKSRLKELSNKTGVQALQFTSENFSQFVAAGESREMVLIVKADVQGSAEAVAQALERLSNEEISVKVLHRGVGSVTENDVQLAVASKARIVAFNVRAEARAQQLAEQDEIEITYSRIIYEIVEKIEQAMKGLRAPEYREHALGRVEVREVFRVPKVGVVAGSYVLDGNVERNALVRLLRDNRVVFEGKMASLRRFKDDVREVAAGFECGIGIEGYQDIRNGDLIEVYKIEEVRPS